MMLKDGNRATEQRSSLAYLVCRTFPKSNARDNVNEPTTRAPWKANIGVARPSCNDCTTGQSNVCPRMGYNGAPGTGAQDGALCTWKILPAVQLARLTPKISWIEAGTIQPLAIAVQMARQAGLKAHQNVMILGGGCIGLLLGAISKA